MKQVYKVKLSDKDRNELRRITAKGKENVRKIRRAHILLLSDGGKTDREIMERVGVTRATVVRIRKRYVTEGLTKAQKRGQEADDQSRLVTKPEPKSRH
ncbi:helix-turn-helix domain-containing protein [Chloroflexi bacterium TSY]|nr:helix-turn-helix domain-containing protein [Chloroflexi bacterium TSY]MBV7331549.1 helix-turn-helix domain-containing protein [Chloroflexi bacterium TSY]MBV7335954.1 helix-turn-helix domain-containing protein [Chloroflexi bacterium TSY]